MITLRRATTHDVSTLAHMNQRLIQDEGGTNPMTLPQLESRIRIWLSSEWKGELFFYGSTPIGYVIYRFQRSEFEGRETVYIRHYYIEREYRELGYGRVALQKLQSERLPRDITIYLEVLSHNSRGRAFWEAVGFEEYSITMRLNGEE
ncbi:MAG: GNAT family N-acetyltransferase [Trueperaceae bacterium]